MRTREDPENAQGRKESREREKSVLHGRMRTRRNST